MGFKRDLVLAGFGILLGLILYHFVLPAAFPVLLAPAGSAIFSPEDGDRVIQFIDSAQSSLDVEMYVFNSAEVLNAIERAHARGVRVRVILERRTLSDDNQKTFDLLVSDGISVQWASDSFKLTHAKFIIVDGERVLVGSHNFSDSALHKNREASVIVTGAVVGQFRAVFEKDWALAA